ncbi:MAG: TetR family transcriptional regulator [Rubrivivax sp.]|nr:TetR family transcriptional regulator [Rubrivivax sp.]
MKLDAGATPGPAAEAAPPRRGAPRAHNRHAALLAAAARVFRARGYGLTSMRDIAAATAMTAGSIYYHYPSKGDLLLAVYAEGVRRVGAAFDAAVARPGTPWQRLERGAAAHLAMLLGADPQDADFAGVFVQVQPHDFPPEHVDALVALRDSYEDRFRRLLAALPLARGTDRTLLRLQLIGALNHVPLWYRPEGRRGPAAIARTMTRQLQRGVAAAGDRT